jgi:hypothetical protein
LDGVLFASLFAVGFKFCKVRGGYFVVMKGREFGMITQGKDNEDERIKIFVVFWNRIKNQTKNRFRLIVNSEIKLKSNHCRKDTFMKFL